jgi:hypothetical protein
MLAACTDGFRCRSLYNLSACGFVYAACGNSRVTTYVNKGGLIDSRNYFSVITRIS